MCFSIVIIRNMKSAKSFVVDDNRCTCVRCIPEAWSLTPAQIALRVLIGAALGVMTCAKGLQFGIAPRLVYPVSCGVTLYVAWALLRYQAWGRRAIGRLASDKSDTR